MHTVVEDPALLHRWVIFDEWGIPVRTYRTLGWALRAAARLDREYEIWRSRVIAAEGYDW